MDSRPSFETRLKALLRMRSELFLMLSAHLTGHRTRENRSEAQSLFSLLRRIIPCSGDENSLLRAEQGIVRTTLKLLREWTPEPAKSTEMA